MGNTPSFLQQQNPQEPREKPLKDKPTPLKEPAFEGYVAGWRQHDFDDDAQEFSFATFQKHTHCESSGYEGDDEDEQAQAQAERGFQYLQDEGEQGRSYRDEAAGGNGNVESDEFRDLDRGRGLGRSGSKRETTKNKNVEVVVGRERPAEPSLERRLERVRQTVADEHALPRRLEVGAR